jgi:hypothetical protein
MRPALQERGFGVRKLACALSCGSLLPPRETAKLQALRSEYVAVIANSSTKCYSGFGTSSAGLRAKNPFGISLNPARCTFMTGHSSGRAMWVTPIVYHKTTS